MLFIGTFFICLFIFMMQFLWRYVDELVGKGLDMSVIAQFFFYSALTLVPISLPLAILLASLITFGNFGERYELLATQYYLEHGDLEVPIKYETPSGFGLGVWLGAQRAAHKAYLFP